MIAIAAAAMNAAGVPERMDEIAPVAVQALGEGLPADGLVPVGITFGMASPGVLKTAGPAVAVVDKLRDAVTGRGRDT